MPNSLLNPKLPRPRNAELEEAWRDYTYAFSRWSELSGSPIHSGPDGYFAAQFERDKELIIFKQLRDDALMAYFSLFDLDQKEAFG